MVYFRVSNLASQNNLFKKISELLPTYNNVERRVK